MTQPTGKLDGEPLKTVVYLVTDAEMTIAMLLAVKAFIRKLEVPRRRYLPWLYKQMERSNAAVFDRDGNEISIIDLKDWEQLERDSFEFWIRDWQKAPERHITPRIKDDVVRERIRLLITALRVIFTGSFGWIDNGGTGKF